MGDQDIRSTSKEASLVYTPSPGFVSPPNPNLVVTPSVYHSMAKFSSPTHSIHSAMDLTQQTKSILANLESSPQDTQHPTQDRLYSDLIVHDVHFTFSDEEIQSILSLDWSGNPVPSAIQSDSGVYMSSC